MTMMLQLHISETATDWKSWNLLEEVLERVQGQYFWYIMYR